MNQRRRRLSLKAGPDLRQKHALDLILIRKRKGQRLNEAEAHLSGIRDQLKCRHVHLVEPDLTVADHPIAGELKASEPELFDEHDATFERLGGPSDLSDKLQAAEAQMSAASQIDEGGISTEQRFVATPKPHRQRTPASRSSCLIKGALEVGVGLHCRLTLIGCLTLF